MRVSPVLQFVPSPSEFGLGLSSTRVLQLLPRPGELASVPDDKEKPRRVRPGFFAQARAGIRQQSFARSCE